MVSVRAMNYLSTAFFRIYLDHSPSRFLLKDIDPRAS